MGYGLDDLGVRIRAKVSDLSLSKSSSPALGRDVEPVSTAEVKKAENYTPLVPMCLHCVDSDSFTFNLLWISELNVLHHNWINYAYI